MRGRRNTPKEFWAHVNVGEPSQCWEWQGYRNRDGYGIFGMHGELWRAPRLAWLLENGPIDDGLVVRHLCHNPPCVNPAHLLLGTRSDNAMDDMAAGRGFQGERGPAAKLTWEKVREIRRRSNERGDILAKEFGVSEGTISMIRSNQRWKE